MKSIAFAALIAAIPTVFVGGPRAQVMMGAHVGSPGDANWQAEFVALETQIGRKLAIDSDYADWASFPDAPRLQWDIQNGRLPMQSWRVVYQDANPNSCATAAAIAAGTYDTQLARQAAAVKAVGGTVLVRFNYEMTDNQENTCFTGFPIDQNLARAGQEYIAAWRHVVSAFRAVGATNVKWVWAPGADAYINSEWTLFYPGAAYVDWIAIDNYNKVDFPDSFATDPGMPQFAALMPALGKPLMVSENAAFQDPTLHPDPQTVWLETARSFMKGNPAILAFIYWDSQAAAPPPPPYNGAGYHLQGRGLAAYKAMANDPYFMASGG